MYSLCCQPACKHFPFLLTRLRLAKDCTGSNPVKGTIHFHNECCLSVSLKATDSNISSLFK